MPGEAATGRRTLYLKTADNRPLASISRGDPAAFSADSKFAVFPIKPPYALVRQAKIKKKKPGDKTLKASWSPSGFGKIQFSENGEKLFFGTAPDPLPQDTTLVDFEHAKLDIWNDKDDCLQPMQLKTLKKDLQRNYLAVVYPKQANILRWMSLRVYQSRL